MKSPSSPLRRPIPEPCAAGTDGRQSCLWPLDPGVLHLNHGAFGACPREVLAAQQAIRDRLESNPMAFFLGAYEPLRQDALRALSGIVGAEPEDLAPTANATAGISAVLESLSFEPGDEILTTDHTYPSCRNALDRTRRRTGASAVTVKIPFPLNDAREAADAVLQAITPHTRLALIDHITSPTALMLPLDVILPRMRERGILTLVDGAHGPGMVPLNLQCLGSDFYAGNLHKWICAPKGAGFLHVRRVHQAIIRPCVTGLEGAYGPGDLPAFQRAFAWTGTADPSAFFVLPACLRFLETLSEKGLDGVMAANRNLALEARRILCERLNVPSPCPESMVGSMAAVPLPDGEEKIRDGMGTLQRALRERFRIEVPVIAWPEPPSRLLRVSAHAYNAPAQYTTLADALAELL